MQHRSNYIINTKQHVLVSVPRIKE